MVRFAMVVLLGLLLAGCDDDDEKKQGSANGRATVAMSDGTVIEISVVKNFEGMMAAAALVLVTMAASRRRTTP